MSNLHPIRLLLEVGINLSAYTQFTRWRVRMSIAKFNCVLYAYALYLNPDFSATMLKYLEVARFGSYIPVSHSLTVCWRIPSS